MRRFFSCGPQDGDLKTVMFTSLLPLWRSGLGDRGVFVWPRRVVGVRARSLRACACVGHARAPPPGGDRDFRSGDL